MTAMIFMVIAFGMLSCVSVAIALDAGKKAARAEETSYTAFNRAAKAEKELQTLKDLIPEDFKEENKRRGILMRDLNDEMERRLQAEQAWNEAVGSILNYNVNSNAKHSIMGEN